MLQKHSKGNKGNAKGRREPDEETLSEFKEAFKIFDSKNTGTSFLIQAKLMPDSSKLL